MSGLRQLKLMTRLSISAVIALAVMLVIMWESISSIHELVYDDRKVKTRHLIEVAHGVVASFHAMERDGSMSRDTAQRRALETLKALRYEKSEYFWVNDLAQPLPKMVMHPTVPALDGKELGDARFNKATLKQPGLDGKVSRLEAKNLFVAFNEVVREAGHGYVEYLWPKPKAGGGVTDELYTKLSYVKGFEPWGWVIGSGIYIDDVDAIFWGHTKHTLALALGGTLLLLGVAYLVRKSILDEFGGEPRVAQAITERMGGGDLTGEIPLRRGDSGSVLYVLRQMQDKLRDMLRAIFANARKLEANVERLAAESNKINLATQVQASVVQQTRTTIGEVADTVRVVTALARDTEDSSRLVSERAQEGARLADEVAAEMQTIASTVATSSSEVGQLVERTREINQMAAVIREIADQTNLLALNAAIEAARAGEQGRGFAVVADEVRKLAERTAKATNEIGQTLSRIQSDTQRAVGGMEAASPVIASGVAKANSAAGTLREIERQSQATLAKMRELNGATQAQTTKIGEIVGNVDQVMQASRDTEEVIRESVESSAQLEAAARELFAMVSRFEIGEVGDQRGAGGAAPARALMEWSPALMVGHREIDAQHQKLVEIANRLNEALQQGRGREACGRILDELVDYTVRHFAFEERLMQQHGYGRSDAHVAEHKKLIADVSAFKRKFDSGEAAVSVELMGFLRDWLVNHILKADRALAGDLKSRGIG
jgi:methyl-accepting chemotaxis protein